MTSTAHRLSEEAAGDRAPVAGRVDGPVTQRGVIASEWLKFRSLRSTLLVLGAAVAGMVAFGAIIAFNTRNPTGLDPEDVVASGPLQGYYLGQLLMAALGVLVVSGEYSSGMIRATFAAVTRRLPVLIAKAELNQIDVARVVSSDVQTRNINFDWNEPIKVVRVQIVELALSDLADLGAADRADFVLLRHTGTLGHTGGLLEEFGSRRRPSAGKRQARGSE